MKIVKHSDNSGTHRTGSLVGVTAAQISQVLGFGPNIKDDPYKVVNSWCALVDGNLIAIWDYKGSHEYGVFSTYGNPEILDQLFGSSTGRGKAN